MSPWSRVAQIAMVLLTLSAATIGCSSQSEESSGSTATTAIVLQAPIEQNDFCSQMYAIRLAALQGESPTDPNELISQYQNVLAVAPAEVQPDLQALIDTLSSTAPTTVEPEVVAENDDGEGWQPSADPAERVFEYVETYCAGTASNPGPAATDPP